MMHRNAKKNQFFFQRRELKLKEPNILVNISPSLHIKNLKHELKTATKIKKKKEKGK